MALVNCPECGRENVSDSAAMCPACGFGLKEYFSIKYNQNSVLQSSQIDESKYSLVITGYCDTDTAAYAGVTEIMEMDLSYDEAMNIFSNCPYIIDQYDTKSEALHFAEQFDRWGIEVYIECPDGTKETFGLEGLGHEYIRDTNYKAEELVVDLTLKGLSFLIPFFGLIVYCINVSKSPKGAKKCLHFAIVGFFVEIIAFCLFLQ